MNRTKIATNPQINLQNDWTYSDYSWFFYASFLN